MVMFRMEEPATGAQRYRAWRRRLLLTLANILLLMVVCALGLYAFDQSDQPRALRAFDALWNMMNVVTTLGDLTTLTHAQKLFLMAAMSVLVVGGGYGFTQLTGVLTADDVRIHLDNRKAARMIEDLRAHVIVAGFGVVGRATAARLRKDGVSVLVIDADAEASAAAAGQGFLTINGLVEDEATLARARIGDARALIVTIADPWRKLATTLAARAASPSLHIAILGSSDRPSTALRHAGADEVIAAEELIADALVTGLKRGSGS